MREGFAKGAKKFTGMTENEISNIVIKQALKVHTKLGAGLLESAYKECLFYELHKIGFKAEK